MCVNYRPTSKSELIGDLNAAFAGDETWPAETWQDYAAPFIVAGENGSRIARLGTYGMVPFSKLPPGVRFTTMNARSEEVSTKKNYKPAWMKAQLCLVPMVAFYEPNWESGKHIRYRIEMADKAPFAVAGLWREWDEADGQKSFSFTQLTVNADEHPVMKHFHKPEDEKRSLVILQPDEYDDWLNCKDPERARSFMHLLPPDLLATRPEPKPTASKKVLAPAPPQESLF
ncbi:SOS response-associated peptidase [Undibacterium sp.]|uniref:SOS response-associated peptidase n=1 Tax=Undibacterium sp. TaxID=1914977 RepID=UPI00374DA5F3